MKARVAALVFARARWREGEPTDQLHKVAENARERASIAYERDYIDHDTELAVAKAADKMRDVLKERR